jgi:hypothetical protein
MTARQVEGKLSFSQEKLSSSWHWQYQFRQDYSLDVVKKG